MTSEQIAEVGRALAVDLFRAGDGTQAETLVLTTAAGRTIGKWTRAAVQEHATTILARTVGGSNA